jgi:hypothetical protein
MNGAFYKNDMKNAVANTDDLYSKMLVDGRQYGSQYPLFKFFNSQFKFFNYRMTVTNCKFRNIGAAPLH